ncbi:MAG: hypothetical protein WC757_04745 [Candidatus Paceibacterota bacterium]|jgi:hypothetical protein
MSEALLETPPEELLVEKLEEAKTRYLKARQAISGKSETYSNMIKKGDADALEYEEAFQVYGNLLNSRK